MNRIFVYKDHLLKPFMVLNIIYKSAQNGLLWVWIRLVISEFFSNRQQNLKLLQDGYGLGANNGLAPFSEAKGIYFFHPR